MKKIILPLALLCITFSTFAQDRRGGDPRYNDERALRECRAEADLLRQDNRLMSDRLRNQQCGPSHEDRRRLEQLERENQDLRLQNSALFSQVERLKIDNARLELELRPDIGRFNLAQSVLACGKIATASYAQLCAAEAKAKQIQASVIEQCARISSNYYALECVKASGNYEVSSRQVEACLGITTASYVPLCVASAAEKRTSAEVIKSCMATSTSDYYRLECVKSM